MSMKNEQGSTVTFVSALVIILMLGYSFIYQPNVKDLDSEAKRVTEVRQDPQTIPQPDKGRAVASSSAAAGRVEIDKNTDKTHSIKQGQLPPCAGVYDPKIKKKKNNVKRLKMLALKA